MATKVLVPQAELDQEKRESYVKACLDKYFVWIDKYGMPNVQDSLVEWDRIENRKQLLDWNKERCFTRDLREQARKILSIATRVHVSMDGNMFSFPGLLKVKGEFVSPTTISDTEKSVILDSWRRASTDKYRRMRLWGLGADAIQKAYDEAVEIGEKQVQQILSTKKKK